MAGDNLTVTIGADTSKLRGELKLAREQLKALGRDVSGAVKRGDVAVADSLSKQYGTLESRVVGLNHSLKGTAGALDQVTAAGRRTEGQFRRIGVSANSIGRLVGGAGGGLVGGLISFAAVGALTEAKKLLDDQIERITKIRDLARDTARSPASVAAAQNVARAAGVSEDDATTALKTQAANFAELQKRRLGIGAIDQSPEAQAKREELIQQRARLLGGGSFSDKDKAIDLSKIYEILTVDIARFKDTEEGAAKAANFIDTSFLKMVNSGKIGNSVLNEIAKNLYGVNKASATIQATENIQKYNAELAKTQNTTNNAVSDAEALAVAQGKLANQFNESSAGVTSYYTNLKTASAEAATQLLKGTWTDALIEVGKLQNDVIGSLGKSLSGALTGRPQGMPDTADQIQGDFKDLPNFFQGMGKTIGDVWKATFGSIIGSAEAAEVRVGASAKGMSASFVVAAKDIQNAMSAALGPVNAVQGGLKMTEGAAQLAAAGGGGAGGASVFRGPGTGFPSPYGPVDTGQYGYGPRGSAFGETSSPARGGDPREGGTSPYLQSYAPGMSNYQALPPHRVDPIEYSKAMGWQDAARSASDAAIASQNAAEASKMAVQGWIDPSFSYAGGGMIRGAGSGTSDSIMARLSNGEFVMRAAAVKHWGAGFLSNLNGYAGGGMVMPSRGVPSFADGGLVAAGGGTGRAVHLHLGGHEFALSGASSVVDSLVTAANQQRMRSGGLKPSWYGGRASG